MVTKNENENGIGRKGNNSDVNKILIVPGIMLIQCGGTYSSSLSRLLGPHLELTFLIIHL